MSSPTFLKSLFWDILYGIKKYSLSSQKNGSVYQGHKATLHNPMRQISPITLHLCFQEGYVNDASQDVGSIIFKFLNLNFILLLFKKIFVIQLQLSAFSPHPSTPPQPNPPPSPTFTLPFDFVHVSFIVVPVIPSSHCPRPGYC